MRRDLAGMAHMVETLEQLTKLGQSDRITKGLGYLTQYFGGDFAKMFGKLDAGEKDALISLATNSMKGTLSNQDINTAKTLIPKMWKSRDYKWELHCKQ